VKVYAYPGDDWGCGAYRVKWPAMAVSRSPDADVTIIEPSARHVSMTLGRNGQVAAEHFPDDADVIVFQRPTLLQVQQVIPMLQARGVAVVVDMDDDLTCIDPRNPASRALGKTVQVPVRDRVTGRVVAMPMPNPHAFNNATEACRLATMVTVTTPALAQRYGAHGRVRVLPNCVPAWYLDIPRVDTGLIGWGGSVHSHPDDLQQLGPALARLVQRGTRFETVGDPDGVARALGLPIAPSGPGPVALHEWPLAIARFGIGIAPLAPTRFNDAKSWLKPLEYNAVGVPAVVSPSADYQRWADTSPGTLVAPKPRAWEATLRGLVDDPAWRAELSAAGREAARQYTMEANAWRWAEAWQSAVDIQRQKVPAGAT
jgi:hypothetical protein